MGHKRPGVQGFQETLFSSRVEPGTFSTWSVGLGWTLRRRAFTKEEKLFGSFDGVAVLLQAFHWSYHRSNVSTMPAKRVAWGSKEKNALLKGFRDHGWDPEEKKGRVINATIKSVEEIFKVVKPFFSKTEGGKKTNNNQIYDHYRSIGCESIVARTREGIRRKDAGASVLQASRCCCGFVLFFAVQSHISLFF